MNRIVLLVLLFSLSTSTLVNAQSKQSQKERFEGVYNTSKTIVQSEHFQFVANVVFEGNKRESFKDISNQISINKTDIIGELKTFSADNVRYSFKDEKSQMSTSFDDEKQQISIAIKSKGYTISIEVKPNGNTFLMLSGNGSADITYRGTLLKL